MRGIGPHKDFQQGYPFFIFQRHRRWALRTPPAHDPELSALALLRYQQDVLRER